ncbi:MAG: hypothetical protein E7661_00545 [Ruminococcaceae bacterium]|nr:hypothetical protein [Oscillospiraceae bacterium]
MPNFLKSHRLSVGDPQSTPFVNAVGVYQDGTTPLYRDADGRLWGMSGHSHVGHIGMFCGTSLDDMKELYPIQTNFCVGHAEYAFSGIRYPEGVKPRGSLWPFGLYICPETHRFFCFFHNESGWNGKGTAYDSLGPCDTPHFDSDFRHVGLMHSDDEGRNWVFDRWVLTAEKPCFTERYNPGAGLAKGQPAGKIFLGSGDFSLFVEPVGDYLYLFYNIIRVDMDKGVWDGCDVYVARTRKRTDGIMGDFVKFYNGSFCEAGNLGRETPIVLNAWHPRVTYFETHGTYLMSASRIRPNTFTGVVEDVMLIRESCDLLSWSEPMTVEKNGVPFGNHYCAMVACGRNALPQVVSGDEFAILLNHNGTDVVSYPAVWSSSL